MDPEGFEKFKETVNAAGVEGIDVGSPPEEGQDLEFAGVNIPKGPIAYARVLNSLAETGLLAEREQRAPETEREGPLLKTVKFFANGILFRDLNAKKPSRE